jgi:TPR repeat protein
MPHIDIQQLASAKIYPSQNTIYKDRAMHWKNSFTTSVLAATFGFTVYGAPSLAYMAEKEKLNKAEAELEAGKYKEGAVQFKELADGGCPFAQCLLGVMYLNGKGVTKNVHTAINYFTKSAKQGSPDAEEHLGEIYQYGEEGIKKDNKLAASWYRRAAYHGNSKAQLALGKMFMSSQRKNEAEEGKVWLAKASQIPGAIADDARKAIMSIPGMGDVVNAQGNFEFAMANLVAGGTLSREPNPTVKPIQMRPPADMPGALEENWDRFANAERTLAADVTGR